MRYLCVAIILSGCFFSCAYAGDSPQAQQLAQEYAQEQQQRSEQIEQALLSFEASSRLGVAFYKEEFSPRTSKFETFYSEALCSLIYRSVNDIEHTAYVSYGQTMEDTENWYISEIKNQTNDIYIRKVRLGVTLGKVLSSSKYKNLEATPFLGYGFRYVDFRRSNFVVLNTFVTANTVSEKYYVQHVDGGIRGALVLTDALSILGSGSIGYVFYNKADNSTFGDMEGSGGVVVDSNLGVSYALNDSCKLLVSGFVELERLEGGEENNVLWPDNKLDTFGGNIGVRFTF